MDEETILRISKIEERARELEDNIQLIDNQLNELEIFRYTLESVVKSKEKEILSSLGKRVYLKAKIEYKESLFVEVGAGVVVRKTPEETLKITKEQIERLQEVRGNIFLRLQSYHVELQDFINSIKGG